jgi:DMSO/TMAO reductase YedYZ molybdopterin-dependent catalytic subunit
VAELVFLAMGVVVVLAVHSRLPSGPTRYYPAVMGVLVAMVAMSLLVDRARAASAVSSARENLPAERRLPASVAASDRRSFLILAGVMAASSLAVTLFGRALAHNRAKVEAARASLMRRFGSVPAVAGVSVGVDGVAPWVTPVSDFYRIDTALSVPLVVPGDWQVRIHGMVDKEITLDYEQLLARGVTHDWLTLCCVSNPVGGDLISNAYWTGVPIAPILAEAGVHPDADAVLSRSVDGWTAGTPLAALTDGRNALFAVAMNGQPLTPEHGFPVRMVVPGLYGYVSATKWVVDLEVTRFSDFSAFWTQRGWSAQGPVKTQSRIDVPRNGSSASAGTVMVAGVAWAQHRGIRKVEVQVDDRPWQTCRIAADPTIDSWRQWSYEWQATSGSHTIQVRATDGAGETQTSRVAGVLPNGATGYDNIQVTVR